MARVASWDDHLAAHPMPKLMAVESAESDSKSLESGYGIVARRSAKRSGAASSAPEAAECTRVHYLPIGSAPVDGKKGLFYTTDEPDADPPF